MRIKQFLLEYNVSFDRVKKLLGYKLWEYDNFNLNSTLNQKDFDFLLEELSVSTDSTLQNTPSSTAKSNLSKKSSLAPNFEITSKNNLGHIFPSYILLMKFLIINYLSNNKGAKSFFVKKRDQKGYENLFNNSAKLLSYLKKLHHNLLENYDFYIASDSFFEQNHEILGLNSLIERLFYKKKNPFLSTKIIIRYRKIYNSLIHKYRYETYPIYKKFIDHQNDTKIEESKINTKIAKTPYKPVSNIEYVDWESIHFFEGYIVINIHGINNKFQVQQSKRYLDKIKHYYSFKNTPKLKILYEESKIIEIKNIEILFYHIDYLTISNSYFETKNTCISHLTKYDKSFFKTYLPSVFNTASLNFLCEICDENFPILPIPELVLNSNEKEIIQDSFIFKCGNKLIWESIEKSKATYIFKFDNFDKDTQCLFNYIVSKEVINKRKTLIQNTNLKKTLKLNTRIYHNNFQEWKNDIFLII